MFTTRDDSEELGSDMKALGITVKDGALHIPAGVPKGTNVRITVESVFDSSKKTALQATVFIRRAFGTWGCSSD